MHRRWIGIRVSAVLAIAGSLATLALGGVMLFGLLVAPRPAPGPTAPPFPLAAVGIVMAVLFAGLSAWGICTAIGIFRRRGWARVSMVVFAILLTFMGVGAGLTILFMPALPSQEGVSQNLMDTVRWVMAGFYGVLAAIGVWWLVLFNLSRTKEYFAQDGPSEPSGRPLSVSVIGWFLLIGSLFLAVMAVFRLPAFVFGVVFTGWGGLIVYTMFAAAQIYLGTGLLYLQEPARVGTIGYFCLTALSGILNVAPTGLQAKMETLQKAMPRFFPNGATATMPQPGWMMALMAVAIAAVPVWFLVRQRAAFVKAAAE